MSRSFSLHEFFHKQKLGILSESVNEEDYNRERDALDNLNVRESEHPTEIETEGGLLGLFIGEVNGIPIYLVEDSSVRDTMVYVVGEETVAIEVDGEMVPGAIIYAEYGQTEEVSEFLAQDIANTLGVKYQKYPYGDTNSFSLHEFFHKQKLGILSESVNEEDYDRERDAQAMGYPNAAAADADNWGRPKEGVQDEMLDHPGDDLNPVADGQEVDHNEYTKYESVEELMKEIEKSTNEAALKHKMERVKAAYTALEEKATSLEEGDNAEFVSKTKVKEMKANSKKLRKMYEKYEKIYEKNYNKEGKKPKKKEKAYEGVTSSTLVSIIKEEINRQSKKKLSEDKGVDNPYYSDEWKQAEELLLNGLTQVLGDRAGWVEEDEDGELYGIPGLENRDTEIYFTQKGEDFYIGVTSTYKWLVKPTKVEVGDITSTTAALAKKYKNQLAPSRPEPEIEVPVDSDEAQRHYHNLMVKMGHRKGPIFPKKNFRQEYDKYIKSVRAGD